LRKNGPNGIDFYQFIAAASANRGWLVKNENLNKQYTMTHTDNLNLRASLEPLKDVLKGAAKNFSRGIRSTLPS
jgi:hypothetical protein